MLRLKALAPVCVLISLWATAAFAVEGPRACVSLFGAASTLCRAPGVGGDWRALEAGGVPAASLALAVSPCAKRRGGERETYACAREALWTAAREAADGNALTGRYVVRDRARGLYGEITLLERRDGAVRIAIRSERTPPGHTCRIDVPGAWRTRQGAAWKGELVPGQSSSTCDLAIRQTSVDGVLVESDTRCSWGCGGQGVYEGPYRLAR